MRRCRVNPPNRCYHLISRIAHRAYFLDGDERTRLVDFIRRVATFSVVKLLAYSVMANHFHVFVYIGRPEALSDAEIVRRISALYSNARFEQVMKKWNELAKIPDSPAFRRYRKSFLRRMWNASEFMKTLKQRYTMSFNGRRDHHGTMWEPKSPAYLRTTLGIASSEYFTKAYLRPLVEAGLIERNDPDHPNSPQQKYAITKEGERRIGRVAPL